MAKHSLGVCEDYVSEVVHLSPYAESHIELVVQKKVEVVNGTYILLIKWTPWHLFVTAISGGMH